MMIQKNTILKHKYVTLKRVSKFQFIEMLILMGNFQKYSTVEYHYGQMINYRAFLFSIQFTLNRLYKRFVFFLAYSYLLVLRLQ